MASVTPSDGTDPGSLRDRVGFPHLVATTVALVAATILLGIATKATGSGLACDANWPLCDGGLLNLFPASVPSFFEWIHRVVAMVAGVFIVVTALSAWRGDRDRRITRAVALGAALTPVQVLLGRETVRQYELTILDLHFWTAVTIFVLFAASAVLVWSDRLGSRHATIAFAVAAALVPAQVAVSPLVIDEYSPVVQTLQYALALTLLFAVLLAAIVGRRRFDRRLARVAVATPPVALAVIYLGRESVGFDPLVSLTYLLLSIGAFLAFAAATLATRGTRPSRAVPDT